MKHQDASQRSAVKRVIHNVLADNVEITANFFTDLLELERSFTNDWYVMLVPKSGQTLEIGVIDRRSEFVPKFVSDAAFGGVYLTLVVTDVWQTYERAKSLEAEILAPPLAFDYGQTRMLIRDPNGLIVDISSPTSA